MPDPREDSAPSDAIADAAAAWVLRCDRGLTAVEQDEYSQWLAADPRHGAQLARHRRHWQRLDGLAEWRPEHTARPNPDLLAPPASRPPRRPRWPWRFTVFAPLAAAAAGAALFFVFRPAPPTAHRTAPVATSTSPSAASPRTLADGSVVELNRDAEIAVDFSPSERRVRLVRGEAHFTVSKNPARPFVVTAGTVGVRALGTAFNVRFDSAAVEVLVTEGQVQLNTTPDADTSAPTSAGHSASAASAPVPPSTPLVPSLTARQRAVVSLVHPSQPPQIATLMPGEIARVLAWQHRLLDFNATPLRDILAEFNRRNAVQLVLAAPALADLRLSASLRSDNLDGFVHLLEAGFGVRATRSGTEIVLSQPAP